MPRCLVVVVFAVALSIPLDTLGGQLISIGVNFRASQKGSGESGFIPPDTMGAVGPEHVLLLINGRYELYDKNPHITQNDGVPLAGHASDLTDFWTDTVGISNVEDFAFDPRVTYDPFTQRWYTVSVDSVKSADNGYLFAVSKTSDPTDGWDGFRWESDPTGQRWADFPMLGFDGSYVYISANHFAVSSGTSAYQLHTIPKADLLSATPTLINRQTFPLDASTNQTVQALDNLGPDVRPYHLWEEGSIFQSLDQITEVDGSLSVNTNAVLISLGTSFGRPAKARQPDGTSNLRVDDDSFSSRLIRINGSYWGAFLRSSSSLSNTRPNIVRWFEIDAIMLASDPSQALRQVGTIGVGTLGIDDQDLHYPSISVNEFGDVVIGFSASGPAAGQYPSAYAVTGHTDHTGTTTFGNPILLKEGTSSYHRLDTKSRNRWGDYTSTVYDPADPNIFWTFQEWASSQDRWNVQTTELITYDAGEFHWANDRDGSLNSSSSWLVGTAPGAHDHAIFSRSGDPFTVTFNGTTLGHRLSIRQGTVTFDLDNNLYALASNQPATPALIMGEFNGFASLTIGSGGALLTPNAWLAPGSLGTADLTIKDSDTIWVVDNAVFVGGDRNISGGSAVVTIETGAGASIGQKLHVYKGSSLQLDGGSVTVGSGSYSSTPNQLIIHPGGTLAGSGNITANVSNGGLLEPGESLGTLQINGSYNQDPGGLLSIEIAARDSVDQLSITGNVSLSGTVLAIMLNDYLPSVLDTFDILNTSGGTISGLPSVMSIQPKDHVLILEPIINDSTLRLQVMDLFLLADMSADGSINNLDIPPFLIALQAIDEIDFLNQYPGGKYHAADMNRDSMIDFFDVDFFIHRLAASTGQNPEDLGSLVPESATALWLLSFLMLPCRSNHSRRTTSAPIR